MKKLLVYCLFIIFLITLTSSFAMENLENPSTLSLNRTNMAHAFYENFDEKDDSADTEKGETNEKEEPKEDQEVTADKTDAAEIDLSNISPEGFELGDSGEDVLKYQRLLYYLDYIKNVPDGNFGEQTQSAVEEYQEDRNLNITGVIDSDTQESLLKEDITFVGGKEGEEIQEYQMILYYLDYIQGYPNGSFDSNTETAVSKYQKSKDLEETGQIDKNTKDALKKEELEYTAGKRGTPIMEYQGILIELGYLHGNPDGQLSSVSVAAIKEYQDNNDLEETGNLDLPTQESLKRPISEQVEF